MVAVAADPFGAGLADVDAATERSARIGAATRFRSSVRTLFPMFGSGTCGFGGLPGIGEGSGLIEAVSSSREVMTRDGANVVTRNSASAFAGKVSMSQRTKLPDPRHVQPAGV